MLPCVVATTPAVARDDVRIEEIVRRIVGGVSPSRIILFGSRSRPNPASTADYDILVVWKDEEPPPFRAAAVRRCLRGLGLAFDIAVVTPGEFARFRRVPWHIVHEAVETGRVLHAA